MFGKEDHLVVPYEKLPGQLVVSLVDGVVCLNLLDLEASAGLSDFGMVIVAQQKFAFSLTRPSSPRPFELAPQGLRDVTCWYLSSRISLFSYDLA